MLGLTIIFVFLLLSNSILSYILTLHLLIKSYFYQMLFLTYSSGAFLSKMIFLVEGFLAYDYIWVELIGSRGIFSGGRLLGENFLKIDFSSFSVWIVAGVLWFIMMLIAYIIM